MNRTTRILLGLAITLVALIAISTFASGEAQAADTHNEALQTATGWEWHYDTATPNALTSVVQSGGSTEITIPNSLDGGTTAIVTIGYGAFDSVDGHKITKILGMPSTVITLGSYSFFGTQITSVVLGTGVTTIAEGAFKSCSKLTAITIPNSVTTIGVSAFEGCTVLASATIGTGITTIPASCFKSTGLTSITIPNGVTSIDGSAFCYATSMTNAVIGTGMVSIYGQAFYGCSALKSIGFLGTTAPTLAGLNWITNTNAALLGHASSASNFPAPGSAFNGLTMGAADYTYTLSGSSATITRYIGPGGAVAIPATLDGYAVVQLGIGASPWAFDLGNVITSITSMPSTTTTIARGAMYCRTALVSVTFGTGVTTFGQDAMSGCGFLTSIYFTGNAPTSLGGDWNAGLAPKAVYFHSASATGFSVSPWTSMRQAIGISNTVCWDASTDGTASTAGNWHTGVAPVAGQSVSFSGYVSVKNCDWNLGIGVVEIWVAPLYSGTITITSSSLVINGSLWLYGGAVTNTVAFTSWAWNIAGGAFTLGANATVNGFVTMSSGTLNGNVLYTLTCAGAFTYSGGVITTNLLQIIMSGVDKTFTVSGGSNINIYSIRFQQNTNVVFTTTSALTTVVIDSGKTVTIASGSTVLVSGSATWTNDGTVAGPGTIKFRTNADYTKTFGVINAPAIIMLADYASASRTATLGTNTVFGSTLAVNSDHATYTMTLASGNYKLTVTGVTTIGTRGIMTQGTGNWMFNGGLVMSGASSALNQGGNIYCNGTGYSQTDGTFTGNSVNWVSCGGSFLVSGGSVPTDKVLLKMTGTGSVNLVGGQQYLHSFDNVGTTTLGTSSYIRVRYQTITEAGSILNIPVNVYITSIVTATASTYAGTVQGLGTWRISALGSVTLPSFASVTITSNLMFEGNAGLGGSAVMTLAGDTTIAGAVSVQSSHASYTNALALGGYNINCGILYIGALGRINGTGAVTCTGFVMYSATAMAYQGGTWTITGNYDSALGTTSHSTFSTVFANTAEKTLKLKAGEKFATLNITAGSTVKLLSAIGYTVAFNNFGSLNYNGFLTGVNHYWISATNQDSSVVGAWDVGTVPGLGDAVFFNAGGAGNCNWVTTTQIGNFSMLTGYAGTVTLGSNMNVGGSALIQAGNLVGYGSYVMSVYQDFTKGASTIPDGLLILSMYGNGRTISSSTTSINLLTFNVLGNITSNCAAYILNTYSTTISSGKTLTLMSTMAVRLDSWCTFSNLGTIAGNAAVNFYAYGQDKTVTFGVINANVAISCLAADVGNRTITLGANTVIGGTLYVYSQHASYTFTLALGGKSLSCTGLLTVSTRAIISGTGTVTCGGFTQSGASSSVTMGGAWTVNGAVTLSDGAFVGHATAFATISGSYARTGCTVSAYTFKATFTGTGTISSSTFSDFNKLKIAVGAAYTISSSLIVVNSDFDCDGSLTIASGKAMWIYESAIDLCSVNGTLSGAGMLYIKTTTNRALPVMTGTISCPITFANLGGTGNAVFTLSSAITGGAITIISEHATQTCSINTAGYSITATSITLGQAGTYGAGILFLNGGTVTAPITINANGLLTQDTSAVDTTVVGDITLNGGILTGDADVWLIQNGGITFTSGTYTSGTLNWKVIGNTIYNSGWHHIRNIWVTGTLTLATAAQVETYAMRVDSGATLTLGTSTVLYNQGSSTFTNSGTVTGTGKILCYLTSVDYAFPLSGTINAYIGVTIGTATADRTYTLNADLTTDKTFSITPASATYKISVNTNGHIITATNTVVGNTGTYAAGVLFLNGTTINGPITVLANGLLTQATATLSSTVNGDITVSGGTWTGDVDVWCNINGNILKSSGTITGSTLCLNLTGVSKTHSWGNTDIKDLTITGTITMIDSTYWRMGIGVISTYTVNGEHTLNGAPNIGFYSVTIGGSGLIHTINGALLKVRLPTMTINWGTTLMADAGVLFTNDVGSGDITNLGGNTVIKTVTIMCSDPILKTTLNLNGKTLTTNALIISAGGVLTNAVGTGTILTGLTTVGVNGNITQTATKGISFAGLTIQGGTVTQAGPIWVNGTGNFLLSSGTYAGSATYPLTCAGDWSKTGGSTGFYSFALVMTGTGKSILGGCGPYSLTVPVGVTITVGGLTYIYSGAANGVCNILGTVIANARIEVFADTVTTTISGTLSGSAGMKFTTNGGVTSKTNMFAGTISAPLLFNSPASASSITHVIGTNLVSSSTISIGSEGGSSTSTLALGGFNLQCTGLLTVGTRGIISGTGTVTCGGFTQSGASSVVTQGGNWTVNGDWTMSDGRFIPSTSYTFTLTGSMNKSAGTLDSWLLKLITTGTGKTIFANAGLSLYDWSNTGSVTLNIAITTMSASNSGSVVLPSGKVLALYPYNANYAFSWAGTTSGAGIFQISLETRDATMSWTGVSTTVRIVNQAVANEYDVILNGNSECGILLIYTGGAANIRLDTNGKSLTATSITLGQAGSYGSGILFANGGTITAPITINANGLLTQDTSVVDTTVVGDITLNGGTLTGDADVWFKLNGNLLVSSGTVSEPVLKLMAIGAGKSISCAPEMYAFTASAGGLVTLSNGVTSARINVVAGTTVSIADGKTLTAYSRSGGSFVNDGIIQSAGTTGGLSFQYGYYAVDQTITMGVVNCPVTIWVNNPGSSKVVTIGANTVLGNTLGIYSSHATNLLTVNLNGKSLTATRTTIGQNGTYASASLTGSGSIIGRVNVVGNGILTQTNTMNITGDIGINGGTWTGATGKWWNIYGSVNSVSGAITSSKLYARFYSDGKTITTAVTHNFVELWISANISIGATTSFIRGLTVDVGKTLAIQGAAALQTNLDSGGYYFTNNGQITTGTGAVVFGIYQGDKELSLGVVGAVVIRETAGATGDYTFKMLGPLTTNSLSVYSNSATRTMTVDINNQSIASAAIYIGTPGAYAAGIISGAGTITTSAALTINANGILDLSNGLAVNVATTLDASAGTIIPGTGIVSMTGAGNLKLGTNSVYDLRILGTTTQTSNAKVNHQLVINGALLQGIYRMNVTSTYANALTINGTHNSVIFLDSGMVNNVFTPSLMLGTVAFNGSANFIMPSGSAQFTANGGFVNITMKSWSTTGLDDIARFYAGSTVANATVTMVAPMPSGRYAIVRDASYGTSAIRTSDGNLTYAYGGGFSAHAFVIDPCPIFLTDFNDVGVMGDEYQYDPDTNEEGGILTYYVEAQSVDINYVVASGYIWGRLVSYAGDMWVSILADDGHGGRTWQNYTVHVNAIAWGLDVKVVVIGVNGLKAAYSYTANRQSSDVQGIMWSFGDGVGSRESAPVHQYALDGRYYVICYVTDKFGSVSKDVQLVKIGNPVEEVFVAPPPEEDHTLDAIMRAIVCFGLAAVAIYTFEQRRQRRWAGSWVDIACVLLIIATVAAVLAFMGEIQAGSLW